jgi:hypothetical protein
VLWLLNPPPEAGGGNRTGTGLSVYRTSAPYTKIPARYLCYHTQVEETGLGVFHVSVMTPPHILPRVSCEGPGSSLLLRHNNNFR